MPSHSPRFTQAYVYILSSSYKRLYVGVTINLTHRIHKHKTSANPNSFTSRYKIDKLVHYEGFKDIEEAIPAKNKSKDGYASKKSNLSSPTTQHGKI